MDWLASRRDKEAQDGPEYAGDKEMPDGQAQKERDAAPKEVRPPIRQNSALQSQAISIGNQAVVRSP